MQNNIIVIGSANADLVIHSDRMPLLGETLIGDSFQINAGGKGLNQAVAIARLGGSVSFCGALGTDGNGDMLKKALSDSNVSFEGFTLDSAPTGIAMIVVVNGDNFIIIDQGANAQLTPELLFTSRDLSGYKYCVLQLEIPMETVARICDEAKAKGIEVILNPAPYNELDKEILKKIDYLVPNEHEAKLLTGITPDTDENCKKAVLAIRDMGVKNVIITLGAKGCVYNVGDEILFCPAQKVKAVDTTSAGDCFIGATVTKLSQGASLTDAISFATKACAITVCREGASASIPFAHEIN